MLVAGDPEQCKIAHGFQENSDRAYVFAESPVIMKRECKRRAERIVKHVAAKKQPEHYTLQIPHAGDEQHRHKDKGRGKGDITDKAQFPARLLRLSVRQKVKQHRSPARISAPASSEHQRPEYFRNSVMDRSSFKHSGKEIVPEALDLHILPAYKSKVDQHICTDEKLRESSRVPVLFCKQKQRHCQHRADVAEVDKIKQIVLRAP